MKTLTYKSGFSLFETLMVVAIVVILTAVTLTVATRIDNQSKEQLTRDTIHIITTTLKKFEDYGYKYNPPTGLAYPELDFYRKLKFPLDCNGLSVADIQTVLATALGKAPADIAISTAEPAHRPEYSGSEILYFFLHRVPPCREILSRIDDSLITAQDATGNEMRLVITDPATSTQSEYTLNRFIDPWGVPLRYDYYIDYGPSIHDGLFADRYENRRNFPVVTSAGPDELFNTADDISNRR